MKVLFISRAFPPTIGGIENQNAELYENLSKICAVTLIANRKGKRFLPIFLIFSLMKGCFLAKKHDVILLGDGVLSIIGLIIGWVSKIPVVSIVHGLDLTFPSKLYQQLWVKYSLSKMSAIFPVSNETKKIAVQKGINHLKCKVIFNGVSEKKNIKAATLNDIEKLIGIKLNNRHILLTVGRLIKRKGVHWFVKKVMTSLDDKYIYLIAGDGAMRQEIADAIKFNNLSHRVILLGRVTDETRQGLYTIADIYIQPNILINDDIEGFGLVVLEAAICGLPVVSSKIQGLKDAIQNNKTGIFVEPENSDDFIDTINDLISDNQSRIKFGINAKKIVANEYSWERVATMYIKQLETLTHENHANSK